MKQTIDKRIEQILNSEQIKEILSQIGRGRVSPVSIVSLLIGEVYTYCFVHNDGNDIEINDVTDYVKNMRDAYYEYNGSEEHMLDIRTKEIAKSIARRLKIDISNGTISDAEQQQILEYFLKNYVGNGYVMHSFSGACEESIRNSGFSSTKRIWDSDEIMRIAHIFEAKDVISPVGAYSHYSGGRMYVESNTRYVYWHALSAPEWFQWFTSANHNKNSRKLEDSPYYLRDYEGCRQNVQDLCANAGLNQRETEQVMDMFEKNWKLLGTEKMCVALIPKSIIGKNKIEDAIIPGQAALETIKTVLSDGRGQYKEHDGNVLKQTVTKEDMLIMGLPNSKQLFGEHEFRRETSQALYDPDLVLDMIFRGEISGFELSKDKIDSIIETLRRVHNNSPEVERKIQNYKSRVALFTEQEVGKTVEETSMPKKESAQQKVQKDIESVRASQEAVLNIGGV